MPRGRYIEEFKIVEFRGLDSETKNLRELSPIEVKNLIGKWFKRKE